MKRLYIEMETYEDSKSCCPVSCLYVIEDGKAVYASKVPINVRSATRDRTEEMYRITHQHLSNLVANNFGVSPEMRVGILKHFAKSFRPFGHKLTPIKPTPPSERERAERELDEFLGMMVDEFLEIYGVGP